MNYIAVIKRTDRYPNTEVEFESEHETGTNLFQIDVHEAAYKRFGDRKFTVERVDFAEDDD